MTDKINIAGMRKAYKGQGDVFHIDQLTSKEPFANFEQWFKTAYETPSIHEANAMSLATATKDGCPSVRIVLLKGFDKRGFLFYTNHTSRKAQEIVGLFFYSESVRKVVKEENPHVGLNFCWSNIREPAATWSRQVRIEGVAEKLGEEESTIYFQSRPKSSQIGACVSHQSQVIPARQVLNDRKQRLEEKFSDVEALPKPDYWGGYVVKPHYIEFWQGQTDRIHDRLIFRRPRENEVIDSAVTHQGEDGWLIERLSP